MAFLADDDVIVHRDSEWPRNIDDRLRHLDIGMRWRGVSGRMIVHEDQGRGGQLQRAFDHLARINRRVIDGADLLDLIEDQLIPLVEMSTRNCSLSAKAIVVRQ